MCALAPKPFIPLADLCFKVRIKALYLPPQPLLISFLFSLMRNKAVDTLHVSVDSFLATLPPLRQQRHTHLGLSNTYVFVPVVSNTWVAFPLPLY